MSNMKSRLPGKNGKKTAEEIDAFIAGANERTVEAALAKQDNTFPWEEQGVREDVTKVYNLRLPEPYLLKLKYIAEHTPDSMQKFCLDVLQDAIDSKIEALTK